MNDFKSFVVVMVCIVLAQGVSAAYPGYFSYQQPSQGYFPPAPVFYQPRPTLRYDIGLGQSPPQHYYSPPDNTYRGFSYETRYQDGASSHVVYVTGPQSQELMQRSFAVFRNVLPVAPASPPRPVSPTVLPTLSPIIVTSTNSSSAPVVPISAPTVNIFPPQFIPAFNLPRFIQPPFPYRSFMSPFFNAIPPQLQSYPPASETSPTSAEPASEVQESIIREVAVPEVISNRIADNLEAETATTVIETSSVSTESTTQASTEATSSGEPAITTEAQPLTEPSESEVPQATESAETIEANDDSAPVTDAPESEVSTEASEMETTPEEPTTEA